MIKHAVKAIKHGLFRRLARLTRTNKVSLIAFPDTNNIHLKTTLDFKFQLINQVILSDKQLEATQSIESIKHIITSFYAQEKSVAETYCEVANFIMNIGQPDIAKQYFKLSLDNELNQQRYSQYLQCLLMCPSTTDVIMYEAASQFNELFFANTEKYTNHDNQLDPNKILNIGYICHFFHNSVSQTLLIPFLKAHNKNRVRVHCYSDADKNEVPDTIKATADAWHDTKALTDTELAELIRAEHIDILLEMNGHINNNRYSVIAKKPAPVQVNFYNHCGTTGISAIDYNMLGDEITIANLNAYTELVYTFKGVCGIAIFPDDFPKCEPPPFLKNNYITFGSFGAAHKVNHLVVKLWCKVLNAVPNSKFYMKAGVLDFTDFINAYKKLFDDEGIDISRVHFEGFSNHREMLKRYSQVDIALDTFPYAAGTTTMEALWMGVPVITLAGSSFPGQNGKAIVTSIGHPEFIARSEEEYAIKAAELAACPERLISYRQQLRTDFRNSPRGDAKAYAKKLEDSYRDMWQRYCNSKSAIIN